VALDGYLLSSVTRPLFTQAHRRLSLLRRESRALRAASPYTYNGAVSSEQIFHTLALTKENLGIDVVLVSISTGDIDGKGEIREKKLQQSAQVLGLPSTAVTRGCRN
jgi:hypothetical protein